MILFLKYGLITIVDKKAKQLQVESVINSVIWNLLLVGAYAYDDGDDDDV